MQQCFPFRILIFIFLLILPVVSPAQVLDWTQQTFNNIFNDTSTSAEPKFIAYPTLAYTPETRWEIGVSALYVYYADRDSANRLSEINAFTFVTQERQYGIWLDHALYSDQSKWFFLGRLRYQRFPLLYYGIGPDAPAEEQALVDANSIALRERVLRNIGGNFYVGLQVDLQRLSQVDFNVLGESPLDLPAGSDGSSNLGMGIGFVYDDRHNVLNVRDGFFGETGFLHYDDAWGSEFSFTHYFLEARYFKTTAKNQVLATQVFGAYMDGEVPFNQLALMGGESLMRGYYLGRYRDNTLLAAQAEYRFLPFPFSKRWGAAAFLAAGGVAPAPREINLGDWQVAGGAGLRFMIFPGKDIFTRFDVAFTREGPGYYLFIGEAF
jgi:hypothetical protein